MREIDLLAAGESDYRVRDLDTLRVRMRDRKGRDLVAKTTTAAKAVGRRAADGVDVSFDPSAFDPAPAGIGRTARG